MTNETDRVDYLLRVLEDIQAILRGPSGLLPKGGKGAKVWRSAESARTHVIVARAAEAAGKARQN